MYINCISLLALDPINVMGGILYTEMVVWELEKAPLHRPSTRYSDLHMACERRGVIKNGHLPKFWEISGL